MTAIITSKFRILNASDFRDTLETSKNHYLFVGRPREWTDDLSPPLPLDNLNDQNRAWESMMGMKKILESNASNALPRHNWDTTGDTIYAQYSDTDADLFNHPTSAEVAAATLDGTYTAGSFYVMTDEYHVFKCLSNNGGVKSTDKPLKPGNSVDIVETSDGYQWKYMYTISTGDALKFLTDAWMPVKTLAADDGSFQWLVQAGASNGVISNIHVTDAGLGYDQVRPTAETLTSAAPTTAVLNANAQAYATGNDFYNGCTLWIETGLATGESKLIVDYDHGTNVVTLDSAFGTTPSPGDTYKILPTVEISGNGTGAIGKAFVDTGTPDGILSVAVTSVGSGYQYATATISGAGGSGAELVVSIPPVGGHGKDATFELGGHFVILNVNLEYNEGAGDFPLSNDYRQIGILRDATDFGTSTLSTATTRIASYRLEITPLAGTFQPDEDVVGPILLGSPAGFIVDYDSVNDIISYIQDETSGFGDFSGIVGETVTGSVSGATGLVTAILDPEVNKYDGHIIYLENRRPILRAPDQQETIRVIIEF